MFVDQSHCLSQGGLVVAPFNLQTGRARPSRLLILTARDLRGSVSPVVVCRNVLTSRVLRWKLISELIRGVVRILELVPTGGLWNHGRVEVIAWYGGANRYATRDIAPGRSRLIVVDRSRGTATPRTRWVVARVVAAGATTVGATAVVHSDVDIGVTHEL